MKWMNDLRYELGVARARRIAAALILLMALADFLTLVNLFANMGLSDSFWLMGRKLPLSEINVYALTLAILLEGNPTVLGNMASKMTDQSRYKVNDRIGALVGTAISGLGCLGTIAVACYMRNLLIEQGGGRAAFKAGSFNGSAATNGQYIVQRFLLFSPILTSVFAGVLSWWAFRSESGEELERSLDRLHDRFLEAQRDFRDSYEQAANSRMSLWTSLTASADMPQEIEAFRRECFERMRSKAIENSIMIYPAQIARYNAAIEEVLIGFIEKMSTLSTIPADIAGISVREIAEKHDESVKKDADAWNYDRAGPAIEARLKKVLDNGAVVAQYKTTARAQDAEGGWQR